MLMYLLILLSLVLTGIVGLQFTYLFYIDRIYKERRKYLKELEQKCASLAKRLDEAERRISEQNDVLYSVYPEIAADDDAWADLIEEI